MNSKIVVIEDNTDVRENIAEILELSSYEVETAANGVEGIKVIKAFRPDLIVCDIMMPELDGYGVLHILQRDPETAAIPFIFLTAKSEKTDFRKGMNLGADDYITKPFEEVELLTAVEMRLQKSGEAGNHGTAQPAHGLTYTNEEVFRSLDPLLEEAESRSYPKKAPVFLEGAYPRHLFRVQNGSVKESRWTEFGKELILNIYSEGDYFGWPEVVLDTPYRTIASTLEDTELIIIPKEQIHDIFRQDHRLYAALLERSIHENRLLQDKLLKTAYESVRKRMAYLLVQLHQKLSAEGKEEIQLLREDIAALAGISKETAIRVLSSFKDEGLITVTNNEIVVNDAEDLDNIMG